MITDKIYSDFLGALNKTNSFIQNDFNKKVKEFNNLLGDFIDLVQNECEIISNNEIKISFADDEGYNIYEFILDNNKLEIKSVYCESNLGSKTILNPNYANN